MAEMVAGFRRKTLAGWLLTVPLSLGYPLDAEGINTNSYQWSVTDPLCVLEPFSIEKFCSVLNGRSILMVGDSISGQYMEYMELLFGTTGTADQYVWKDQTNVVLTERSAPICGNTGSYVTYVRNDLLLTTTTAGSINGNMISPWVKMLRSHSILILNTGAHYRPIKAYTDNMLLIKQAILDSNYNGHVFFRTTPRGHINCSNIADTIPISKVNSTDWNRFFVKFPTQEASNLYHKIYMYELFPEYNRIAKKIIGSSSMSSTLLTNSSMSSTSSNIIWKVLDMSPLLELRADVHKCYKKDWLHIDMNRGVVYQFFWELLYNAIQDFI
jgi:hypothetical protein